MVSDVPPIHVLIIPTPGANISQFGEPANPSYISVAPTIIAWGALVMVMLPLLSPAGTTT